MAVSFINECANIEGNDYIVFMSPNVSRNIDRNKFGDNFTFYEFGKHSLYSLRGLPDLCRMKKIEKSIKPDVVFSVFGPSLWKPKAPHLQGYAYGHYVYKDSPLFKQMRIKEKMGVFVRQFFHIRLMKSEGDFFVCETADVSRRLHDYFGIKEDRIFTVSNTASSVFLDFKSDDKQKDEKSFKFYILCSNAPNKNLRLLNHVIPLLKTKRLNKNVRFYITIPETDYERLFTSEAKLSIINVGPLKISECPSFVSSCDALFLPTLIECFSASYPEAMIMGKPILTSNLSFAYEACKDAALYFDPLDANDAVNKIETIVNDDYIYNDLIEKGRKQFLTFPSAKERAEQYIDILQSIKYRRE